MFGDKTVKSGDLLQMKSTRAYIDKDHDGFSLWNPHLFCGMPAYAISTAPRWFDMTSMIYSVVQKTYAAVFTNYEAIYTFSFLLMAITAFFFMRSRGAGHGVSFLVAAAMVFSSGITVLYFIGHMTKIMALALIPFILMMLLKFQKEIKIIDVLLLIFGMHLFVLSNHIQIVYYVVLLAAVYYIFYFVYSFIKKDSFLKKQLVKSMGVMAIAAVIAVLMSFDSYYSLFEYKPYSTRGTSSVTETAVKGKTETEQYQYNTQYSFSPGEVMTFLIPSYYGFGNSTYKGETAGEEGEVNTYIGQMENVDGAMYMGIIVFILAMMAFFLRWKEPFIKFSAVILVFFLLVSFGKTFPPVFNLLYHYLPGFDNFRAPSMILHMIQVLVPILAGFSIMRIIEIKNENNEKFSNKIKIAAIALSVLAFLSFLLTSVFSKSMVNRVNEYASSLPQSQAELAQRFRFLAEYTGNMFTSDIHINMLLIAILFWCIYLYLNSKFSKTILISSLTIFILLDLFRIGNRESSFMEARMINDLYATPEYVTAIKQQNDKEPFRIISLKQDGSLGSVSQSVNYHTYFNLEDFYGYSSVKPRGFNDIIQVVSPVNLTLWKMLNVKYVVLNNAVEQPGFSLVKSYDKTFLYRFDNALPRAYFVDSVGVKSGMALLTSISQNEFDPKHTAYVDKMDFQAAKPGEAAYAKIISYKDEKLVLEANATGNNFLFFGTNFIPTGWKALIDGKETKIVKTNHSFMGIVVPEGKHKVEFVYAPASFVTGKYISLILNIFLFAGIILAVVLGRKKKEAPSVE